MRQALWLVVFMAGCLDGATHEDRTAFHADGAFEAVVAAGGDVLEAREDPGIRGKHDPSIPLAVPELDAAWGDGRYALDSIHWWGPPGPPQAADHPAPASGPPSTALDGLTWQGFQLDARQVQVVPGSVAHATAREWYDTFLAAASQLDAAQREEAAEVLFSDCGPVACTAPLPDQIDAARVWQGLGGLAEVTDEDMGPASGRLAIGSWWFLLEWDAATLGDEGMRQQTILHVGANDVVEFVWQSGSTHSNQASWEKLDETLRPLQIPAPDPADLQWVHQEILHDG